jgi:hypothetical protein
MSRFKLGLILGVIIAAAAGAAPASAELAVSRFTVDGGGSRVSGGTFELGATIAQPDAGQLSGGSFVLKGGFWRAGGTVAGVEDGADPGEDVEAPDEAPLAFHLLPAAPNPLREKMLLTFELPRQSFVRAGLYDAAGRLVRTLVEEDVAAGRSQRTWDRRDDAGAHVAAGIYFLRFDAGAYRNRQKIVVID